MAWRDFLRQGSFRGAVFYWTDVGGDLGRRVAKHEFAKREKALGEDLGKKTREFNLNVFVFGPGYGFDRDALLEAVEKPGPGRLVHPTLGEMDVFCTGCNYRESASEGGKATFALTFMEAGELSFAITSVASTGFQTYTSAIGLNTASQSLFARLLNVEGFSDFVALAGSSDLNAALGTIQRSLSTVRGFSDKLLGVASQISFVKKDPLTYLGNPVGLGGTLGSVIAVSSFAGRLSGDTGTEASSWQHVYSGRVTPTFDDVNAVRLAQLRTAQMGLSPVPSSITPAPPAAASSPDRLQQAANSAAIFGVVRQAALAEAAQAAVATPFPSQQQAAAVRDELADLLDAEMLRQAAYDDVHQALADLRLSVVRELTDIAVRLPLLVTVTPTTTLPAEVLAHQLYGDPTRAADIVARNSIRHPGFVPGGRPLQVLTDG